MTGAWTLETIAALTDPVAIVAAVKEYDIQIAEAQAAGHRLRDDAIYQLLLREDDNGPTAVANRVDMSLSHVKSVRHTYRRRAELDTRHTGATPPRRRSTAR